MATMSAWKYDVVIVGAGPAGITAAIALAKADVSVLVVEAGVFPGAENWSGAVYFAEQLAHPDVLGEKAVLESAYERPVTKRGFHIYNGHSLVGLSYRNPSTFAHCYTVLRPTYDHYLAELAKSFGATILTQTTVDGLLRDDDNRIVGVHTDRGSIYADAVFLAEGDASQLVTKEGYERTTEPGAPHFLQGIKEVIELDPEQIERTFNLPRGEGAAFEILLRNGSINNRTANLNMGGFLYTNQASISLGLVLPLDNLAREFGGDHNRLMEWFKGLPEIRRWTNGGRSVAYGAKIIRGGGFRELPQLVDNGLAIGGAATGIGLDFPYPNFTGPATAMGRLFANAVKQIRAGDKNFSRERLEQLYEQPLRQTHYFKNVEFLEKWPHYVEHTRVFFSRFVDLKTGALYVAGNPSLHAGQKLWQLAKFLRETLPLKHWGEFFRDLREQRDALGLNRVSKKAVVGAPLQARLGAGEVSVEFSVDGQPQDKFLWPLARIFRKAPQILSAACDHVYRNDDTPLPVKLHNAISAVRRGVSLVDLLIIAGFWLFLLALMPIQWACELIKLIVTRPSPDKFLSSFFQKYRALTRARTKLDPDAVKIEQPWEEKLSLIRYFSENHTHIKVYRPENFENRAKIADSPLWHVCPAKVYECHTDDLGQSQLIVNFENCIKCETCWRSAPNDVDWTRQRKQRLIFNAPTQANRKLLVLLKTNRRTGVPPVPSHESNGRDARSTQLAGKLREFCETVYSEPRYLDAGRTRWLQHLLEQAQSAAEQIRNPVIDRQLARIIAHAKRRKFFWAEADARQLLEQLPLPEPEKAEGIPQTQTVMVARIEKLFTKQAIKDLEHGKPLSKEQINFLRLLADAPAPPRSVILRELGRKDLSLAALVSGIYSAQIVARPELAKQPWIGLTAARAVWKEFQSDRPPTLPEVAADLRAMALGAGEMLLERCKAHATSRVQFPGLFKDEDGRDGIAKFGSVKQLLGEMEAQVFLLEAMENFEEADAPLVKILAAEALGPDPGSLAYNAGQIFGGTAYSEDDVLSKFYRDSTCFSRLLFDDEDLKRQLGEDADAKLRAFALDAVKRCASEDPSELGAEIVKHFAGAASRPQQILANLGAQILEHGYFEKPLERPPAFNYRDALQTEQHYDYGDYLTKPFDATTWRYAPEMLHADAERRAYYDELYKHFTERYWNRRVDGLPYHRLVEKLHQVPLEDVRDMIARGFTRMYIPKEFGGEGRLKADYYILCPLSMRYADPSYALTIMAHSSIGTTPILLGLNQDLPRAKQDLQEFLANQSAIANLKSEIQKILRMLDSPEALKVKKVFTALGEKVKSEIGRKPMLRAVASDFIAHFMDAGRAGLRVDLSNFKSELSKSLQALDTLRPRAEVVVAELDRRAEAHKLFLRLISAGQISAFALTEPNAGSDSGGIQTRAELKKVEVLTDADGAKYFLLGGQRKNILDAGTIDVAKIDYTGYDYVTSTGLRTYDGRPFHDIAQIRVERASSPFPVDPNGQDARSTVKEFYEYYEVNGAKMWITNGHVAGVFCLYARTPEGPTGFMVDRHAEGLVVGKDEEKMGQRGSPTNELGLTSVRVPRENVIGIEGRGQVNALETLNVGRAGLCVSAVAMTAKIVEQTRAFARKHKIDKQKWVQQLIGEMTTELYVAESLAYELIGRFDHHGTKSVRTESAIGKYYASEVLHRVIRAAERVLGIEGCTQVHELEKHRRDARVLNIYEGTNEVQRFLILRDLVDSILPKWKDEPQDGEPVQLAEAKSLLVRATRRAVDTFGAQVWQNANFQPTMFKLAEIAGYIKTMDSTLWRTDWLRRTVGDDAPKADRTHRRLAEQAESNYLAHAQKQIRQLHDEFERDLALLKQGLYPPVVRTAFLALQAEEGRKQKPLHRPPAHKVSQLLHTLVVLNVVPVLSPRPRVADGELLETYFDFDAAGRTALERAVELKRASKKVKLTAIAVAPRYGAELLRRAMALGADDAVLIEVDELPDDMHAVARLVANRMGHCDLVLCGDSVLAAVLGGNLGSTHFAGVGEFVVKGEQIEVKLQKPEATLSVTKPVVLDIAAGETTLDFTVDEYLAALGKPLEIVDARQIEAVPRFDVRYRLPEAPAKEEKMEATPEAAAALLRKLAGVEPVVAASGNGSFAGIVKMAEQSSVPARNAAVFLTLPDKLEGLDAAAECADAMGLALHALVLGNLDEKMTRMVAARINARSIYFVNSPKLEGARAMVAGLQALWKDTLPSLLMAGAWANEILAEFARTFPRVQARYDVAEIAKTSGTVELVWPAFGGKVQRIAKVSGVGEHPLVMTIAGAAGSAPAAAAGEKCVYRVPLEFEYDADADEMAEALSKAAGDGGAKSIADAEFIIDVGYAVRNKENFDLVIAPLKKRLEEIGVKNVMLGGTRKVVEELKLLAPDQQIGQTGQSVNPRVIISIGVSGAPQHIDYIGERATIIAFNKDPDAPLMTLNKRRARPKVVPIVGDLYELVPKFTAALKP